MNHYLILACVLIALIGLFWNRYSQEMKDADVGPSYLSNQEWFRHTAIEMLIDLALFIAICLKIDISMLVQTANNGSGTEAGADSLTIIGAFATATAIYKATQTVILPLLNKVTGGTTARKKLRNKVQAETTQAKSETSRQNR